MINFSLISVSLISLGVLLVLFFNTNPANSSNFIIGTFFLILLVFLFSVFSLIGNFALKIRKTSRPTAMVLRRSLLLAILLVGLLAFSALKVLNVMSALTYTIALVLVEFFFSSKKVERENQ